MSDPITRLGLSCPKGGSFYICQESKARFVGCCTSDPCGDGSGICPKENLRYSSYQADRHDDIPKEACGSTGSDGGLWYTCKFASPPFMGCCTTNPCSSDGCPANNLRGAVLGAAESEYGAFTTAKIASSSATPLSATSSGSVAAGSATTTGTGAVPVGTQSTQSQPSSGSGGVTLSGGTIAGICVGIAVVVCVLVGIVMYMCGLKARDRKKARNTLDMPTSARSEPWSPFLDSLSPTMLGRPEPRKGSPLYTPPVTPGFGGAPGHSSPPQSYYPGTSPPLSHESSWMSLRDSSASSQYRPSYHRSHLSADSREIPSGASPGHFHPVVEADPGATVGASLRPGSRPPGGFVAELPGSKEYHR